MGNRDHRSSVSPVRDSKRDRDAQNRRDEPEKSRRENGSSSRAPDSRQYSTSKRSSRRERSEDEDELLDLEKLGIEPITEDDYFLRSSEYRYWLKKERGRYLDELSGEDARKYFRRFVRRWNDGALKEQYYRPPAESISTRHQWSFSSKANGRAAEPHSSRISKDERPRNNRRSFSPPGPSYTNPESDSDEIGPSLPSTSITQKAQSTADRLLAAEDAQLARQAERKAERNERYQRANEAAPRASGKEGKMEEKRANNASNKEMRDKDASGTVEVDESVLMGAEGGFAAALRARDGAKNRKEEQRAAMLEDRRLADQDRLADRKQKETDTMAMFKAMAKERFG